MESWEAGGLTCLLLHSQVLSLSLLQLTLVRNLEWPFAALSFSHAMQSLVLLHVPQTSSPGPRSRIWSTEITSSPLESSLP